MLGLLYACVQREIGDTHARTMCKAHVVRTSFRRDAIYGSGIIVGNPGIFKKLSKCNVYSSHFPIYQHSP
jgi:hypothetical protein